MKRSIQSAVALLFCAPIIAAGCGGGHEFPTTPVSGVVTCSGNPVSGGTIMFIPVPTDAKANSGKAASGEIAEDGSFTLSTYGTNDGAIVGKHTVQVLPPSPKDDHTKPAPFPCASATVEIEVQRGAGNGLKIEL